MTQWSGPGTWVMQVTVATVDPTDRSCAALVRGQSTSMSGDLPAVRDLVILWNQRILIGRTVISIGLGNAYTQPLSYVIVKVQVDGFQGYNEDKIALVVLDLSNFAERIPVILGTPTISHVINVMKEREIDALGKCQGTQSLVSMKGCSHNDR